jgi:hypothetical protein
LLHEIENTRVKNKSALFIVYELRC